MTTDTRARSAHDAPPYDAILGLGSNIGDKAANIADAVRRISADGLVRPVTLSRLYKSAPWGVTDQDWFINACVSVATDVSPHALLARCQDVEADMGRVRDKRWGPRIIDVDILVYRDEVIDDADLKVPHPLIAKRAFVLLPLRECDANLTLNGATLDELIKRIETHDVVPVA